VHLQPAECPGYLGTEKEAEVASQLIEVIRNIPRTNHLEQSKGLGSWRSTAELLPPEATPIIHRIVGGKQSPRNRSISEIPGAYSGSVPVV
jgi:hypothetical protein